MYVLLTNDDGARAPGLLALAKRLKKAGVRTLICAPARNKSACSHSISLQQPLVFCRLGEDHYALDDGSPSDCVNLALSTLCKEPPALVVSGINAGANLAEDVSYSGTVAAAMEAALCGLRAVAFSEIYKNGAECDFKRSSSLACKMVLALLEGKLQLDERQFLNVNYPDASAEFRGYKACKMGRMRYDFGHQRGCDPRGREYFWLSTRFDINKIKAHNDDIAAVRAGYAAVTPCKIDFTAKKQLAAVQKFLSDL